MLDLLGRYFINVPEWGIYCILLRFPPWQDRKESEDGVRETIPLGTILHTAPSFTFKTAMNRAEGHRTRLRISQIPTHAERAEHADSARCAARRLRSLK